MYSSRRLTRAYLYGMSPGTQRDLGMLNWRKDTLVKEIDSKLDPTVCRDYRSAWEDFLLDHEGAAEYPAVVERKKLSGFVNAYFKLTNEDVQ